MCILILAFDFFSRYEVELQVENMHNPDDHVEMRWFIYCANPVIPADWDIDFKKFQHMTDHFTIGPSMSFYPNSKILKLCLSIIQIFDRLIIFQLRKKGFSINEKFVFFCNFSKLCRLKIWDWWGDLMSLIYRFSTKLTYQGKIRTESGQNQDRIRTKSGQNQDKIRNKSGINQE